MGNVRSVRDAMARRAEAWVHPDNAYHLVDDLLVAVGVEKCAIVADEDQERASEKCVALDAIADIDDGHPDTAVVRTANEGPHAALVARIAHLIAIHDQGQPA